jgi:hypothetical protein
MPVVVMPWKLAFWMVLLSLQGPETAAGHILLQTSGLHLPLEGCSTSSSSREGTVVHHLREGQVVSATMVLAALCQRLLLILLPLP